VHVYSAVLSTVVDVYVAVALPTLGGEPQSITVKAFNVIMNGSVLAQFPWIAA
jgi:hypothetical protein